MSVSIPYPQIEALSAAHKKLVETQKQMGDSDPFYQEITSITAKLAPIITQATANRIGDEAPLTDEKIETLNALGPTLTELEKASARLAQMHQFTNSRMHFDGSPSTFIHSREAILASGISRGVTGLNKALAPIHQSLNSR